jgi:hypothetical protein
MLRVASAAIKIQAKASVDLASELAVIEGLGFDIDLLMVAGNLWAVYSCNPCDNYDPLSIQERAQVSQLSGVFLLPSLSYQGKPPEASDCEVGYQPCASRSAPQQETGADCRRNRCGSDPDGWTPGIMCEQDASRQRNR